MTDKEKADLTRTEVGRMVGAEIEKLKAAQAARDAEQDARAARPSVAQRAVAAGDKFDFTTAYPKTSALIGVLLLVGATTAHAFKYLDTVPMYVLWGIAVCFVPGLVMKVVRLATGLKKAKDS